MLRKGPQRLLVLGLPLLAGCMVGPDYHAPDPVLPSRWKASRTPEAQGLQSVPAATLAAWWKTFEDPVLDELMIRAERGNPDLGMAWQRIGQARAEWQAQRADMLPKINAAGIAGHPNNLLPITGPNAPEGFNYFLLGFDAMWEIDLFGRLQHKLDASTAETAAATEYWREARVTLLAEIARSYTGYRSLEQQILLNRQSQASWMRTQTLTATLFRAGLATRYDLAAADAALENQNARLTSLDAASIALRHQLELLVGVAPDSLLSLLRTPHDIPASNARALLTTPADTLRSRPDVREAERKMAAAAATEGAAFAELFPKISIAAFLGFHNSDLENLFRSSAFAWATGSSISQPIFNFGRIRAGIDLSDARLVEASLNYEKTVLNAMHETENAMMQWLREEQRIRQLTQVVESQQLAHRLAEERYAAGLGNLLDVLDAQRQLDSQQMQLIQARASSSTWLIALYKAMGGAGQIEVEQPETPLRPWG